MDHTLNTRSKVELQEAIWQESLELIQKLIQCHPIYGSPGQGIAQAQIFSYMKRHDWDSIFQCEYSAQDIKDDPEYVDVKGFGSHYKDYETLPKSNIIGIINGAQAGPTVLLNGHIDVDNVSVGSSWSDPEGWKSGKIIDDKIIGRGACDMISGLVSLLTVATILREHKQHWNGRVIITSVVDEEIGGNGTLYALRWLSDKGYLENKVECIIAEPSNKKICAESLGFMHLILSFKRSPIHMGVATRCNSALWDMQRCIENFENILHGLLPTIGQDRLLVNFGIIRGGNDSALPIGELVLEATLFFPEELDLKKYIPSVQAQMNSMNINVHMQIGSFGFVGASFENGNLHNALNSAPYSIGLFPSPCDARLFKKYGIPTIIFGPGNLEQAHAVDEYIEVQEVKEYIEHVLNSLLSYLGHNG